MAKRRRRRRSAKGWGLSRSVGRLMALGQIQQGRNAKQQLRAARSSKWWWAGYGGGLVAPLVPGVGYVVNPLTEAVGGWIWYQKLAKSSAQKGAADGLFWSGITWMGVAGVGMLMGLAGVAAGAYLLPPMMKS